MIQFHLGKKILKRIRVCWRLTIAIPGNLKARILGAKLGKGTNFAWGARIFPADGARIVFGRNCKVLPGAIIAPHPNGSIVFGDNCSINPFCMIYGHGGLKVGNNVRIAAHVTIIPANHSYELNSGQLLHSSLSRKGVVIGSNVWIGSGVRILDGLSICDNSIIGAGAVVTKSIEDPGVYGGVPAKFIKHH